MSTYIPPHLRKKVNKSNKSNKLNKSNKSSETNVILNKIQTKSKKGHTCKATVKTKARYGLHCLNRAKENGYCMIHNKLYTPPNNLENL